MNGVGGCPNVGGICIGCTMPAFPDKFMPFMDEPPGGKLSTTASGLYGSGHPQPAQHHRPHGRQGTANGGTKAPNSPPAHDAPGSRRRRIEGTQLNDEIDSRCHPEPNDKKEPGPGRDGGDPITRIVGSLGIYTKIDFENREVVECHSTRRSSAATRSS